MDPLRPVRANAFVLKSSLTQSVLTLGEDESGEQQRKNSRGVAIAEGASGYEEEDGMAPHSQDGRSWAGTERTTDGWVVATEGNFGAGRSEETESQMIWFAKET
mmetsp:Transcript_16986/g.33837  ORF Transcript_16986/g.33837 Transcript_16986/m.33837 type:complete len:104 (+) Transcript_16986:199-510(+)